MTALISATDGKTGDVGARRDPEQAGAASCRGLASWSASSLGWRAAERAEVITLDDLDVDDLWGVQEAQFVHLPPDVASDIAAEGGDRVR